MPFPLHFRLRLFAYLLTTAFYAFMKCALYSRHSSEARGRRLVEDAVLDATLRDFRESQFGEMRISGIPSTTAKIARLSSQLTTKLSTDRTSRSTMLLRCPRRGLLFLVIIVVVDVVRPDDSPDWLDTLTRYIAEDSGADVVTIITDLEGEERITNARALDAINRVTSRLPVERINLSLGNPADVAGSLLLDTDIDATGPVDTSAMFFLLVHESQNSPATAHDARRLRRLVDAARNISTFHSTPKFLLVLAVDSVDYGNRSLANSIDDDDDDVRSLQNPLKDHDRSLENSNGDDDDRSLKNSLNDDDDRSLENLLQHAWNRRLFDFTIIELPISKSSQNYPISVASSLKPPPPPIVHRLNRFEASYVQTRWTPDIIWFPAKVADLRGHTLNAAALHVPLYTVLTLNDENALIDVRGPNIAVMNITAERLNCSINYTARSWPYINSHYGVSPLDAHKLMEAESVDVWANIFTHHTDSVRYGTLRSVTIRVERLCALVPVFWQKSQVPMSMNAAIYLLTLGVVVAYKIARFALKLDRQLWQAFSIIRVLLAGSVDKLPTRMSERALYTSLLLVSASYSGNIYASVTSLAVQPNVEVPVRSYDDLDALGLAPLVQNYAYNKTFSHVDGALARIRGRIKFVDGNMHHCLDVAAKHKNVTCFLRENQAEDVVQRYERNGRHEIKIVEPCLWADGGAFLLPKGSPYRARIDDIIMRMHDAGLTGKLYADRTNLYSSLEGTSGFSREAVDAEPAMSESMKAIKKQLLTIAMVGYSGSLLVFVGEHAMRWLKRRGSFAARSILKKKK